MRGLAPLILAALALPVPAAAQQAAWAQDSREPLCVLDGLLAAASAGTLDDGRIQAVRNECKQRFGWTDPQADQGVVVAYLSVQALEARNAAIDAGVSGDIIDEIARSLTESERALIPQANAPGSGDAAAFARVLFERISARGVRGDAGRKAADAITMLTIAARTTSDFSRVVGVSED